MKRLLSILLTLLTMSLLSGCAIESSDHIQNKKQEELSMQAVQSVGLPAIIRFSEKRRYKDIFELRDQEPTTYTYVKSVNNEFRKVCDSIGYGIPYATQYTNPVHRLSEGSGLLVPQADPNGLYSPPNAEGTWVLCLDPKTRKVTPAYIEERISVFTFEIGK